MTNPLRKDVLIHRTAPGAYVGGIWQEGAPSSFTIKASVHPANGKDLETLPEGKREGGAYKLITDAVLNTVVENSQNADQLEISGERYEITQRVDWQNNVLNNHQYLATKVR